MRRADRQSPGRQIPWLISAAGVAIGLMAAVATMANATRWWPLPADDFTVPSWSSDTRPVPIASDVLAAARGAMSPNELIIAFDWDLKSQFLPRFSDLSHWDIDAPDAPEWSWFVTSLERGVPTEVVSDPVTKLTALRFERMRLMRISRDGHAERIGGVAQATGKLPAIPLPTVTAQAALSRADAVVRDPQSAIVGIEWHVASEFLARPGQSESALWQSERKWLTNEVPRPYAWFVTYADPDAKVRVVRVMDEDGVIKIDEVHHWRLKLFQPPLGFPYN